MSNRLIVHYDIVMSHHLNHHLYSSLYEVSMHSADGSHEVIKGGSTKLGRSTLNSGCSYGRRAVDLATLFLLSSDLVLPL
mmetsp:Transcript_11706/g.17930  ORF Transcript_11706/g.17930 Transcript_11706/m.17930 type:complete len:80 (+) Transcript_11706:25-264(+)